MVGSPQRAHAVAPEILDFLAAELDDLAQRLTRIEARVGDLVEHAAPDLTTRVTLQDLDRVRQVLEDLARLADTVRADVGIEPKTLALRLRLYELRDRLLGSIARDSVAVGHLDLFP